MNDLTRLSMIKALSECGLRELPQEWDNKSVWVRAIALVRKRDGGEYYAVAKRVNGEYRIVKDFGSISAIHSVKAYYPYEYLEEVFMPKEIKFETKEIKIDGIKKARPELEQEEISKLESKSVEELNEILTDIAVEKQKKVLGGENNGRKRQGTEKKD